MKVRLLFAVLVLSNIPATALAVEPATDRSLGSGSDASLADYEGVEIDLRDGWDGARACWTDGIVTECWDSEAEMLLSLTAEGKALAIEPTAGLEVSSFRRQATCSTFLRLYTGANYTGAVLAIATRYTVLNLSAYGFSNSVSSFRVGACPVAMWDSNTGGGPSYPGATHAYAWAPSMASGWDNRVGSVYQG